MRNKRVVLTALGGPAVLKVIEDDIRDPGANELRIRILACGVAFADVLMRRGLYSGVPPLPYSPGYSIVGIVDARGAGMTEWQPDPISGRNWLRSYRALGKGGRFIGYEMSAAIEGGRRNMALAAASFAWLGVVSLLPGKSARTTS